MEERKQIYMRCRNKSNAYIFSSAASPDATAKGFPPTRRHAINYYWSPDTQLQTAADICMLPCAAAAPIKIENRDEIFSDSFFTFILNNCIYLLHLPQPPLPKFPIPNSTFLKDGRCM